MRALDPEKLQWEQEEACRKAVVHREKVGDTEVQLALLEIPAGVTLPPHYHEKRREFAFVVYSGGARLQIGERFFRPTAGQVFECDPGETLGVVNDTVHPFRLLVAKFGYDPEDVCGLSAAPVGARPEVSP